MSKRKKKRKNRKPRLAGLSPKSTKVDKSGGPLERTSSQGSEVTAHGKSREVTDPRPSKKSKNTLTAMELSITVPTVHPEGDQAVRRVVSASGKGQALDATDHHSGGLGRCRASQVSGHPHTQRSKSAGAKASKRRKGRSLPERSQGRETEASSQWSLCPNLSASQTVGLRLGVSFAGVTQFLTFIPFFQGRFAVLV